MPIKAIDITKTEECPPLNNGVELVIFELGNEGTALVLYGYDEVGLFDHEFTVPTYGISS